MDKTVHPLDSPNESLSETTASKDTAPAFRIEDRRVSSRISKEPSDAVSSERSAYPSFVEELLAQTKQAEKKLAEKIRWMEEEISMTRDRLSREQERKVEAERRKIVESFLEIGDHLERALAAVETSSVDASSLSEGIKLIQTIFLNKLQMLGAAPINPKGQLFNPHFCEAVVLGPVHQPEQDQLVLDVLETGYVIGDQVLRPAKVKVASYAPA
jgi:molecular chaperone GrpE